MAAALPFIAVGLGVAGLAMQASGQAQAGAAARAASEANARALQLKAQTDVAAAEAEARQSELASERHYGTIRANYAASGVDVNTGSPLEVMADQHMQGALAAKLLRFQGQVQAQQDLAAAGIQRAQGGAAATAGYIGAGGTLLTGIGNLAGSPTVQGLFTGGGNGVGAGAGMLPATMG